MIAVLRYLGLLAAAFSVTVGIYFALLKIRLI